MLTQARLKELLTYNHLDGLFSWRVNKGRAKPGKIAGSDTGLGYIRIIIDGDKHYAHRLAWLYMKGEYPENEIDHINRVRNDNRWINLRHVTHSVNCLNGSPHKDSVVPYKGVSMAGEKFEARILINGKRNYLGVYDTAEEANHACIAGRKKLIGSLV